MTPTTQSILARIEADREFWRERVNEADDDTYGRLAAQSRVEALSTLLSWLPKELERLVVAVRAEEESCCPGCDEPEGHGGACYSEPDPHRLASCGRGGADCYCDCQPCQVSHWPLALFVHDVPREVAVV